MRLRLWLRLFLILAGLLVLALGGFVLVQQRLFRAGLLDYVNALDRREAQAIAARLGDEYREQGGWQLLRERPQRFMRIVGQHLPGEPGQPVFPPEGGPPPRLRDVPSGRDGRVPMAGGRREPLPPPPPRGSADLRPRLQLVDSAGLLVAGNPGIPVDAPAIAVEADGVVVGALRVAPLPRLQEDRDLAFQRDQLRAGGLLALGLFALALLASLLSARAVLRPLRQLSDTVRRLTAGELSTRSPVASRDEVGELSADFNRMAEALQKQHGLQRQWMAEISHELRTPLAVLRGEIAALLDGVRPLDAAALASLHVESERLTRLVDDLYDLSLADVGGLHYRFEAVDLGEMLRDVVDAQRAECAAAGLALTLDAPAGDCTLRADPRRLRQLLDNLIGNSRRYTDAPGRIVVALHGEGAYWRLGIDDSAPGATDDALPRLFEPLYRAEGSRARNAGGAGLGLAIVARIVAAHEGRIEAGHSSLGGLRVTVWLPRSGA